VNVYLSGPITGCNFDDWLCNGWREQATRILESTPTPFGLRETGIVCYSPLRGKAYLKNVGEVAGEYEGPLTNRHAITMRDRHDCLTCDAMLVYLKGFDRVSIGTMIELGWADAVRKPIVLVMEPGNVHEHVIAGSIPVACVETLEEGCDVIRRILLP
jgi:nucleoside 2-deoxyribosyltransferase